jgi:hypothetical protein
LKEPVGEGFVALLLECIIRKVAGSWLEALARSRSRLKVMVNAGVKIKVKEWLMTSLSRNRCR